MRRAIVIAALILAAAYCWGVWYQVNNSPYQHCFRIWSHHEGTGAAEAAALCIGAPDGNGAADAEDQILTRLGPDRGQSRLVFGGGGLSR